MALGSTKIRENNRRTFLVVRKELCDRKAETLVDAEEAARWWRYNFVRYGSRLRCCDVS